MGSHLAAAALLALHALAAPGEAELAYPAAPEPAAQAAAPAPTDAPRDVEPLRIEDARTGRVVMVADGAAGLRVAVPAGRYRVARGRAQQEVSLGNGEALALPDVGVVLVAQDAAAQGSDAPRGSLTTLRDRTLEVRLAAGLSTREGGPGGIANEFDSLLEVGWGLTDRLEVGLLHVAYRVGERGRVEFVPYLGMTSFGIGFSSVEDTVVSFAPRVGAGLRGWLGDRGSLNAGIDLGMGLSFSKLRSTNPWTWWAEGTFGFTRLLADRVTVNLGMSYAFVRRYDVPVHTEHEVAVGSVQEFGMRRLPLLAVDLTRWLSLETHFAFLLRFGPQNSNEARLLEGVAITW